MNDLNRGKLAAIQTLFAADGATLPRKAVAGILGEVLADEPFEDAWNLDDLGTSSRPVPTAEDSIRAYGQELLEQGVSLRELIDNVMVSFDLTKDAFSRMIGMNGGSFAKYMNHGLRHASVLKAVAEFFGFDGGAVAEDAPRAKAVKPVANPQTETEL